jgi:hypothetical protein
MLIFTARKIANSLDPQLSTLEPQLSQFCYVLHLSLKDVFCNTCPRLVLIIKIFYNKSEELEVGYAGLFG